MCYCNSCHRLTSGEPLFCNFCARSYNVRLCSSRHINPRSAQACAECGSRELTTPQAPMRFWVPPLLYLLSLLPGILLLLVTVLFLIGFVQALLSNQQLMGQFFGLGLLLGLIWYGYMHLPHFIRSALRKALGHKSAGKGKDARHGH